MDNKALHDQVIRLMAQTEDFDAMMVLGALVGAIYNGYLEELSELCQEFIRRKNETEAT